MVQSNADKIYALDEYILLDEKSELRNEFINGRLFEMTGDSDIENEITMNIACRFKNLLHRNENKIYIRSVKCKIQGGRILYLS